MPHWRNPIRASLECLARFAQNVKVARMAAEITREPRQTFWIATINLFFDSAAVEWSKVFGSYNQDTHWTNVIPKVQHEGVRKALVARLAVTEEEWKTYHAGTGKWVREIDGPPEARGDAPAQYVPAAAASNCRYALGD